MSIAFRFLVGQEERDNITVRELSAPEIPLKVIPQIVYLSLNSTVVLLTLRASTHQHRPLLRSLQLPQL